MATGLLFGRELPPKGGDELRGVARTCRVIAQIEADLVAESNSPTLGADDGFQFRLHVEDSIIDRRESKWAMTACCVIWVSGAEQDICESSLRLRAIDPVVCYLGELTFADPLYGF